MKLEIKYSSQANKYVKRNNLRKLIHGVVMDYICFLRGDEISLDIKKLWGPWKSYYRIRSGKLRIIFKPHLSEGYLYIKKVDRRGQVYK